MELPFENDSLELLETCAMALRPLPGAPAAKEAQPSVQTEALPLAGTVWQRFPGGNAVMKQSGSTFRADYGTVLPEHLPERSAGISAEALSRVVERDARRFDANA